MLHYIFLLWRFSFNKIGNSQKCTGSGRTIIFYDLTPLLAAQEHSAFCWVATADSKTQRLTSDSSFLVKNNWLHELISLFRSVACFITVFHKLVESKTKVKNNFKEPQMTGFDNYSGKNARLHVRAQQFRRTSRTRRDTNERERSKSKD